ncbi:MAG: hypothetical protein U0929_18890 [Planctomycetaceae bacterium]
MMVRLICAIAGLAPPALFGYHLWIHGNEKHGEGTTTLIALLLTTGIVSLPSGYVAFMGAKAESPDGFRLRCIGQIAVGIGMLLFWVLVMVIGNYLTWLLGFMFVWYGILGVAAVNISLGVFSLISNRALLQEMSEINLFGSAERKN